MADYNELAQLYHKGSDKEAIKARAASRLEELDNQLSAIVAEIKGLYALTERIDEDIETTRKIAESQKHVENEVTTETSTGTDLASVQLNIPNDNLIVIELPKEG